MGILNDATLKLNNPTKKYCLLKNKTSKLKLRRNLRNTFKEH